MHQEKEPAKSVCWRVKVINLAWLKEEAARLDRPVSWMINKLIAEAKNESENKHQGASS